MKREWRVRDGGVIGDAERYALNFYTAGDDTRAPRCGVLITKKARVARATRACTWLS